MQIEKCDQIYFNLHVNGRMKVQYSTIKLLLWLHQLNWEKNDLKMSFELFHLRIKLLQKVFIFV